MSGLATALPPGGRWPGAMPWLVAATVFLMALATASALALGAAGDRLRDAAAGRLIVQVIDADRPRRDAVAGQVLARLRALPAVADARAVPDARVAALLAPYLGDVALGDLAVPTLIDVTLAAPAATASAPAVLGRALAGLPGVAIGSEGGALAPLARLVAAVRGVALAIVALTALATALVTMVAARAALAVHAPTVDILHALGAGDAQVARLIQRRAIRDAGLGGAIGLALAILAILLVGDRLAGAGFAVAPRRIDWLSLGLAPLGAIALAALTARIAVLGALRRMA